MKELEQWAFYILAMMALLFGLSIDLLSFF